MRAGSKAAARRLWISMPAGGRPQGSNSPPGGRPVTTRLPPAASTFVRRSSMPCVSSVVKEISPTPTWWTKSSGRADTKPTAVAGGTRSGPLFAGQLVLAALALGSVFAAMLLGHWYLVTPKLSPTPLRRMMWLLLIVLGLQGIGFALAIVLLGAEPITGGVAWLTWLRLGVGILLPIGVTVLAILASRAASLQASTGLLYIGLALIMAGSIAGASLSYLTGVPV